MDTSVRWHILFLEHRLQELEDSLTSHVASDAERERITAKITVVSRALSHYHRAVRLEALIRYREGAETVDRAQPNRFRSPQLS